MILKMEMIKKAEKHIWYEDSDDVFLPFDECIICLNENHKFFDFIGMIKHSHQSYYIIAKKIPGRTKSYAMQLVIIQKLKSFETGEEFTDISYKNKAVCNLGSFQYISEYTQQELKKLAKRKETTKRYGL